MPYDGSNRIGTPGAWPNNSAEERLGWQIPWDKGFVAALDVNTGKRVWTGKRGMSRIAHASPIVVEHDGKNGRALTSLKAPPIRIFSEPKGFGARATE